MSRLRWIVLTLILSLCALASQALGQTVSFLDEDGAVTAVYVEGSRALVRVEDSSANISPAADTVQVQLTSSRCGDAETLTLTETGPVTGVFRGEIKLAAVPPGSASQPGVLETVVNPDPPFDRDTIHAAYGPATATATMVGSKVMFLDRYGRPTAQLVAGQPVRFRVIAPLYNTDPQYVDGASVSLTTPSGDQEYLVFQETGFDTGIFEGEIPSRIVYPVINDQVLEAAAVGETVTAEAPDYDAPTTSRATATLGGDHAELVDAQGKAADFYLESTRVYVEVTAPAGFQSVQARVTADLSGDSETVTLQETGAGTGVYRGSIAMRRGPALADNGLLETTEAGPPYRFDTVRVTYGSGGSADAVPTLGSLTSFRDAFGNEVSAYAAGAPVTVRVEDHNFNNPGAIDSAQATVQSLSTGDAESLTLYETGRDTGLFEATVPTAGNAAPSLNDGRLQVGPGETIQAMHVDAFPQLASGALARIDVLAIQFLDETGKPSTEILEGGVVRVRVVAPLYNGSPSQVESLGVTLQTRFAGDQENLQLTETGPDTGIFEGTIRSAFAYPSVTPGDGTLQFSNSGPPAWGPEEVTATLGDATAVAHMVGVRMVFLDEYGRETTTIPLGSPVRLRVVAPDFNGDPNYQDGVGIHLTVPGDDEYVIVTETGFDTGVFEGSIDSSGGPQIINSNRLESPVGQTITAELFGYYAPGVLQKQAVFTGGQVAFVDETGAAATVVLEGTRARVRVVDHGADLHASADTVTVTLTTEISGDQEILTLTETGPQTGVFEGTILVRDGPVLRSSGAIEPGEEAGPPHAFDTIHASYTAASDGGTSTAAVGTQNFKLWLIDAYGQVTSHYAERSRVYVRLEDHRNDDLGAVQRAHVIVTSATGDQEPLELVETGRTTGIYEGSLPLDSGASPAADGQLQAGPGVLVSVARDTGFTADPPQARIDSLSVAFIDDAGRPTTELLESGLVRVRVVYSGANSAPNLVETLGVSLQTRYAGDQENLQLTETGPDTGIFEGMIRSAFAYPSVTPGDGTLQFSNGGFPAYAPEEVTATLLDATAVAHMVGARMAFIDQYGRETATVPLGSPVRLRVVGPDYNFDPNYQDSIGIHVTVQGDDEYVIVTETGYDTGIFEGSIDSAGGTQIINSNRLESAVGQTITAELYSYYSPESLREQAVFTGGQVAFVDEAGNAATVVLEGTRARVRVVDHGADLHPTADTVTVTLTAELSGDQETVTLTETGPQTGVFEGTILVRNGPVLQNSGAIEPGEDAGPPHAFDTLHASYTAANGGGGSVAAVGLLNFRVWLIDAYGQVTDRYAERSQVYVRVEDHRNGDPGAIDRTYAVVASATGDQEPLELVETGPATGIFEGSLPLDSSGSAAVDGRLLAGPGDAITAAPSTGYTAEPARARIAALSVTFIDETGHPTAELLEGDLVRVRVVYSGANSAPNLAETLGVSLQTRYAGDQENVQLTETGPDTGIFEGTIRSAFAYPSVAPGDGTLQFSNSGWPVNAPEEVTATLLDATAVAHMVGARMAFIDASGQETATVPLGGPVRLRVVAPDFNGDPNYQDGIGIHMTVPGDDEFLLVTETGLDTGVFEGSIDSSAGPQIINSNLLESSRGQTITAELFNYYTSGVLQKQAVFTGGQVTFVDDAGQVTHTILEGTHARLRLEDHQSSGSVTAQVAASLTGDRENITLQETAPGSGVFEGTIAARLAASAAAGNGALETGESPGPPFQYDLLTATYTDPSGNASTANAATLGYRVWFIDAQGNVVSRYGAGDPIYMRLEDHNQNDPGRPDELYVRVQAPSGDDERVLVVETGNETGLYEGSLPLDVAGAAVWSDGTLQERLGDWITVDLDGTAAPAPATARVLGAGLAFLDGSGQVVTVLPAAGPVRVRAIYPDGNLSAGQFDTMTVPLTTRNSGDQESLVLTETGPDTGVFVGSIQVTYGPATPNDSTLQTTLGGAPDFHAEEVTARFGLTRITAPLGTVGLTFRNLEGQVATTYSLGATIQAHLEDPSIALRGFTRVIVWSTGGDTEFINMREVVPGVFEGSLPSADAGVVTSDGTLQVAAGDRITAQPVDGAGSVGTPPFLAQATIVANHAPVAAPDRADTIRNRPVTFDVLANDSDPDGDPLTVVSVTQTPSAGSLVINPDGTLTFTPLPDVFNTYLGLGYVVVDSHGGESLGSITIYVDNDNHPPVARKDTATVVENGTVNIPVLANDSDPDGDPLTLEGVINSPAHGTATVRSDKTIDYKPATGFVGTDLFVYSIDDGRGYSAQAGVVVTVTPANQPPVANADTATVAEDGTVTIDVLANDTDVDSSFLQVWQVTQGAHGRVTIHGSQTVEYTPDPNYNGTDSFTYSVADGSLGSATGTVTVTVTPVNDPPVAAADAVAVPEDGTVSVTVLANDTDVDGDTLTVTAVTQGAHGAVAINPDKTVQYTPAANYNGPDSFTYTVSDGHGGTATGTVAVNVSPVDDAPIANPDSASVAEDGTVAIPVLANDADPEGDTLTVTAVTQGAHGTVAVNPDKTVRYTPAANYNGPDSFIYTISDGNGGTATGAVAINVTPVDDPPVAVNDAATVVAGQAVTVAVLANDTDIDGPALAVTSVTQGAHGTVAINGDQTVTYTAGLYLGSDSFTYTVSDGAGGSSTAMVTVNLTAPQRVATGIQARYDFNEGSGGTIADTSGAGAPLDLTIGKPALVSWLAGGLAVSDDGAKIESSARATKIIDAVQASNEITVEAWIQPESLTVTSPAGILVVSKTPSQRSLLFGQSGGQYETQLKTSTGTPSLQGPANGLSLTHVVYTRTSSGQATYYVNGAQVSSQPAAGSLSVWGTDQTLAIADGWRGDYFLLAVYGRALTGAEVQQNYLAGVDGN
jgi:VCBS repeat-containing protein